MSKQRIAVLANGGWDAEWGRKILQEVDYLICADGGANYAALSSRLPDLLVGDLDSVSPENYRRCLEAGCSVERYPSEKDETDLELALLRAAEKAREFGIKEIWLLGATGKRIDHFLGNVALMLGYARQGYKLYLADPEQELWIIQGREEIRGSAGQQLSLISLSEKAVVTTEGLYYPLQQGVLPQDSPRGISNVFLGEKAVVEVQEGWVMAVMPKSKQ